MSDEHREQELSGGEKLQTRPNTLLTSFVNTTMALRVIGWVLFLLMILFAVPPGLMLVALALTGLFWKRSRGISPRNSESDRSLGMSNQVPNHETGDSPDETSSRGFFTWSLLVSVPVVLLLVFFAFVFLAMLVGSP